MWHRKSQLQLSDQQLHLYGNKLAREGGGESESLKGIPLEAIRCESGYFLFTHTSPSCILCHTGIELSRAFTPTDIYNAFKRNTCFPQTCPAHLARNAPSLRPFPPRPTIVTFAVSHSTRGCRIIQSM